VFFTPFCVDDTALAWLYFHTMVKIPYQKDAGNQMIGSPVRDANGRPLPYVDQASPPMDGWFAYRVDGDGWKYVGRFATAAEARRAVGLPPEEGTR
jgi:hypothetical protein